MKLGFWDNGRFGIPLVMVGTDPQRLKDHGRRVRVAELIDELSEPCVDRCSDPDRVRVFTNDMNREFDNLQHENV